MAKRLVLGDQIKVWTSLNKKQWVHITVIAVYKYGFSGVSRRGMCYIFPNDFVVKE
jgi:hypothetical protein